MILPRIMYLFSTEGISVNEKSDSKWSKRHHN